MYTLYYWDSDNEGGIAICRTEEFSPERNFQPETGCRARPSVAIGEFNTVEELGELIFSEYGDDMSKEECYDEAEMLLYWYKRGLEE